MDLKHRIMDKLQKLNHAQLHFLDKELDQYQPLTRTQAAVVHFIIVDYSEGEYVPVYGVEGK